jgi:nucleotide-binding universal stress UspA family protein
MITLKHILVATDFGDASSTALNYGRELARRFGATLHVLHVVDDLAARSAAPTELLDFGADRPRGSRPPGTRGGHHR